MSDFHASYGGIGELLRSAEMEAAMRSHAEHVMTAAVAAAPVDRDPDDHDPHEGRYKASFRVESRRVGGIHHDRAEGSVVNDAPEAIIVEYGDRNTPRHATLRRALLGAG